MILDALQAVLMVVVLVAVGYFTGKASGGNSSIILFLSKLIINITMPCTVISSFLGMSDTSDLGRLWLFFFAGILGMGGAYLLSKLFVKMLKIKRTQSGVFSALFALSNAGFMGLPVASALFGEPGMPPALFYFIANAVMVNSVGYMDISADGFMVKGEKGKREALDLIKRLASPPIIAVALAFVLLACNARLPAFLDMSIGYLSNLTSPLALLFLGMVLYRTGFGCLKNMNKKTAFMLAGRFILSPVLMFVICIAMGFNNYDINVLTVQSSLPSIVAAAIYSEAVGADTEFAAQGVVVTTLISFATIPLYVAILA